jgi:putative transposase
MGRTRYQFGEAPFPHFLTCTVVGWLPVFTRPETFQLWQEGSQPKMIETEAMLRQKLEYIHDNPVKRGYVSDPTHWRYSSARNYAQIESLVAVTTDW